ncbi:MAG: PadR family transcriptional regulator [Coriobacteriia bacterium]|nr:PadR family transcriptional regulator [Coriobacteriia bacterium]
MSLDHAILGFLADGDLSGYDIKTRCVDRDASHFWTADQAQVYRTLDRLESARHLTSKQKIQTGKPNRKVYRITQAGRVHLDDWLATSHALPPYRDAFLIQVYFGSELSDEALADVLERTRVQRQTRLSALRERATSHAMEVGSSANRPALMHRMTLDAAMAAERAAIDWLDDSLDTLRSLATESGSQRQLFREDQA